MRREPTMDTINNLHRDETYMQEVILDPFVVSSLEIQTAPNSPIIEKQLSLIEYTNKHSQMLIEMLISVSLHIFIMAIFEVYFYFNYVVIIEKKMFLEKIYQYTDEFSIYYNKNSNNNNNRATLMLLFPKKDTIAFVGELYKEYKYAQHEQHKLLNELLLKSYKIIVIITSILIICLTTGVYNYRYRLKWKKIFSENILMFVCPVWPWHE